MRILSHAVKKSNLNDAAVCISSPAVRADHLAAILAERLCQTGQEVKLYNHFLG